MIHLVFDPNEIAAASGGGHNVGAYMRAGDDGTLIGHDSDSLKVSVTNSLGIDVDLDHAEDSVRLGDGTNLVTVTNVASDYGLDVNLINASIAVTATQLDIDDLAFATDSVTAHQGGVWSVTATATQLDIDDLAAGTDSVDAWMNDGTGNALTSTSGALDVAIDAVNIAGGLDVKDICDTAVLGTATAVSTTAVNVVASALANRKKLAYSNEGNKTIYFGPATGLTAANGFPCHPGMQHFWELGPSVAPKFIGETGASAEDIRVLEMS